MEINKDLIIEGTNKSLSQINEQIININGKVLWRNDNSSSAFSGQSVTLNSDDYNMYEIIYTLNTTAGRALSTGKILKGYGTYLIEASGYGGTTTVNSYRIVSYVSDTKINFDTPYNYSVKSSGVTYSRETTSLIPLYIIGYKIDLT